MHRHLRHLLGLIAGWAAVAAPAQYLYTVSDLGLYGAQAIYGPATNAAGWEVSTFSSSFPLNSYSLVKRPGDAGFSALFGSTYLSLDAAYGINDKNMIVGATNLFYSTNYGYRADGNLSGEMIRLTDFTHLAGSGIANIERATSIADNGTIVGLGRTDGGALHVVQLTPIAPELSWDTNGGTAGVPQGGGTWSHGAANWVVNTAGTAPAGWTDGAIARFYYNTTPATVTVTDNIVLEGLWAGFTPNGMTFNASGGTLTFTGQGFIRAAGNTGVLTITAPIAGSAGLWLTGQSGTIRLQGDNTYSGQTRIDNLIGVQVEHPNALGATGAGNETVVNAGGSVVFSSTLSVAETFHLNGGSLAVQVDYDNATARNAQVSGPVLLLADSTVGGSDPNYNAMLTISGAIGESGGSRNLTVQGATLTGTNTFTGDLVAVGRGVTVNQVTDAGVAGALGAGLRLVLGRQSEGSEDGDLHYSGATASTDRELRLEGGGRVDVVNAGTSLTWSGQVSGAADLVKTGAGRLVLTGANTYTGQTWVQGGTLLANNTTGSALGSGQVRVQQDGTLGGTGAIAGLVEVNLGGHLAPGASPGTLTFAGGLTLNDGAILDFELGTVSDLILVTGGTLNGPAGGMVTLNLTNAGGFAPATYTLFDFTGATLGDFVPAYFQFGTTVPGYDYSLALNGNHLDLTATLAAVPEPAASAGLAGLVAIGLAAWRRRPRAISVKFLSES